LFRRALKRTNERTPTLWNLIGDPRFTKGQKWGIFLAETVMYLPLVGVYILAISWLDWWQAVILFISFLGALGLYEGFCKGIRNAILWDNGYKEQYK
jgi:hypothetical protein